MVMPKQIREQRIVNKCLRLEQNGERLNKILNDSERTYRNIYNRGERYFKIKKELEGKMLINSDKFKK